MGCQQASLWQCHATLSHDEVGARFVGQDERRQTHVWHILYMALLGPCISRAWSCPLREAVSCTVRYNTVKALFTVLQCLLHIPQLEIAWCPAESTVKAKTPGKSWGMCSKHCDTSREHIQVLLVSWANACCKCCTALCTCAAFPCLVGLIYSSNTLSL